MNPEFVQFTDGAAVVRFQAQLYPPDCIMEAAHRFTDRCGVHVERDASGDIIVRLSAKQSLTNLRTVAQEFANEALDQVLRFKLAAETEPVRRVLIAQAFSRTDLFATAEDENA